jgi:hypothetical protein
VVSIFLPDLVRLAISKDGLELVLKLYYYLILGSDDDEFRDFDDLESLSCSY